MHGGLNFLLSVVRIETTLANDVGDSKSGSATAFFVRGRNGHAYLVTNKHNVTGLVLGPRYSLVRLAVHVRQFDGDTPRPETQLVEFPLDDTRRLLHHETSDVSIYDTHNLGLPDGHRIAVWMEENYVAEQRVHDVLQPMDFVSFIGFPGRRGDPWIDKVWHTPIARLASISSMPGVPFTNDKVPTTDVTLVNGLSFAGSSGSLVISHARDWAVLGRDPVPVQVVGIMSGGWNADPFGENSGMSYYTRSTSILELLHKARE